MTSCSASRVLWALQIFLSWRKRVHLERLRPLVKEHLRSLILFLSVGGILKRLFVERYYLSHLHSLHSLASHSRFNSLIDGALEDLQLNFRAVLRTWLPMNFKTDELTYSFLLI